MKMRVIEQLITSHDGVIQDNVLNERHSNSGAPAGVSLIVLRELVPCDRLLGMGDEG